MVTDSSRTTRLEFQGIGFRSVAAHFDGRRGRRPAPAGRIAANRPQDTSTDATAKPIAHPRVQGRSHADLASAFT